jgi:hypothetical protein
MTCASVVGMTVRNEGSLDGPDRIDMEGAGSAANARWSRYQDIFDAHAFKIGMSRTTKKLPIGAEMIPILPRFGEKRDAERAFVATSAAPVLRMRCVRKSDFSQKNQKVRECVKSCASTSRTSCVG